MTLDQRPDGWMRLPLASRVECAIGMTQDCGSVEGVYALRDAVMAEVQLELDRLRAELTRATAPDALLIVQGRCPACGSTSLFLGEGGYVTCPRVGCWEPDAASALLEMRASTADQRANQAYRSGYRTGRMHAGWGARAGESTRGDGVAG